MAVHPMQFEATYSIANHHRYIYDILWWFARSERAILDPSAEYACADNRCAFIVHLHACCTGGLFTQTTRRSIEAVHWEAVSNTPSDSCNTSCSTTSVTVNGPNGVGSCSRSMLQLMKARTWLSRCCSGRSAAADAIKAQTTPSSTRADLPSLSQLLLQRG